MGFKQIIDEGLDGVSGVIIAAAIITLLFSVFLPSIGQAASEAADPEIVTEQSLQQVEQFRNSDKPVITSLEQKYYVDTPYRAEDICTATSAADIKGLYIKQIEYQDEVIYPTDDHSITFDRPGQYIIKVTAVDTSGATTTKKINMVINRKEVDQ